MVLNLHGLYGTAENMNYRILTELYPISEIFSPQIDFEKKSPYNIIDGLYAIKDIDYIVGNSLGGFYAYVLSADRNCPCILVNPCIPPTKYLGELVLGYPKRFLNELKQLGESAFTTKINQSVCNTFVILGKNDELLDSKFTKNYLRNVELYEVDGGHQISGAVYKKLMKEIVYKIEHSLKATEECHLGE